MNPESGRTLEPGHTLGHYRLLERVAAGGMGEVWRARDLRLERDVALKVLLPGTLGDESARKRFRQEALALSRLNHPHVATVFDFDTDAGRDFLVMEYVGGVALREHRSGGALPEPEAVRLGLEMAEGLAAAHAEGIVHRDLKPANVRLTADGRLKILDFGLAHLARAAGDGDGSAAQTRSVSLTETGTVLGTAAYMAPEQIRGERAEAHSDVWAAGLVLYEMATGRPAFEPRETAPLMYAILNESPAAPRKVDAGVSAAFEAIILHCIEKDPERRYHSGRELGEDLRRLKDGFDVSALRMRDRGRRGRALQILVPIAAVVALVAVAALDLGGLRTRLFPPARIQAIAVLPLANLSGDPEQEFFADGMTLEVIDELSKVGSLRVTSRTSSAAYKGARKALPQIARELHVDAVIEGAVAVIGDRVRISVTLMQAKPERQLWGDRYEHGLDDVLALQSNIARGVAQQVQAKLTPDERERLTRARRVDPAAHEAYLRGRYQIASYDAALVKSGLEQFLRSVRLDPSYAPAWAGIAEANYQLSSMWIPANEAMPRAREAARRAVTLDDRLADGHAALGVVLAQYDRQWGAAEKEFRRALELNPSYSNAHMFFGYMLTARGRFEEAKREFGLAAQLDPLSRICPAWIAYTCFLARDYDQAITRYRHMLESDSTDPVPRYSMVGCWLGKRMPERALAEMQHSSLDLKYPFTQVGLATTYAMLGRRREALEIAERLTRLPAGTAVPWVGIAQIHATLGDRDRAFAFLEKAIENHDEELNWLNVEPLKKDHLQADPRFGAMLRRLGLV